MQPIVLTVRQWKALARVAKDAPIDTRAAWVAFRPADVIATDGRRLVLIPLPPDPGRDFALLPDDIAPWVRGLPKRVEEDGEDENDGGEIAVKVEHRLTLTRDGHDRDYDTATVRSSTSYVGGEVRITIRPPSWRISDADLGRVLGDQGGEPSPSHLLQTSYLRDLHRLAVAFGVASLKGAEIVRSGDQTSFSFPTEHGDARYIVMRMRRPDEVLTRA